MDYIHGDIIFAYFHFTYDTKIRSKGEQMCKIDVAKDVLKDVQEGPFLSKSAHPCAKRTVPKKCHLLFLVTKVNGI